jgi:hypothetical protein
MEAIKRPPEIATLSMKHCCGFVAMELARWAIRSHEEFITWPRARLRQRYSGLLVL